MHTKLLEVTNLVRRFELPKRLFSKQQRYIHAVDGVSFSLGRAETLGIVGESGCGKTTLSRAMLRLVEPDAGKIVFRGRDITHLSKEELRAERRHMQIVFQDPFGSFNPRMTVRQLIDEPLSVHTSDDAATRLEKVRDVMASVGLDPRLSERHPHEFSGGQRQRIGIARALILRPDLIIGDEPVSALDVSIRAQILNLMKQLQAEFGASYVMVSHDLGAIRFICHRVAVMYLGRVVEEGLTEDVFREPLHPYTKGLIDAVPLPRLRPERTRQLLVGEMPSPINPPTGCHFHPRCPVALKQCRTVAPGFTDLGGGRRVTCHLYAPANGGHEPPPAEAGAKSS